MHYLILFGLLILNTGICAWDAYAAGRIWHDCAGFMKLVAWSAIVMSVCGFISVFACLLGFGALAAHYLTARSMQVLMELTYVMIIIPVLSAGLVITIHSWIAAFKSRSLGNFAVAGYNTFAQVSNAVSAAENMGPFLRDIFGFFSKSSDDEEDGAQAAAVLLVLGIAMLIAFGATYFFWRVGVKNAVSFSPAASAA